MQINPFSFSHSNSIDANSSKNLAKELHKKLSDECMISQSDYKEKKSRRKFTLLFPVSILENSIQVKGPYSLEEVNANCLIEAVVKINSDIADLCDCSIENSFIYFFRKLSQGSLSTESFVCSDIERINKVIVLDPSQEKRLLGISALVNELLKYKKFHNHSHSD